MSYRAALPALPRLHLAARTAVGPVRQRNEDNDVVEQIRSLAATRKIANLVEDQQRGRRVLAQTTLHGGQRLLLEEVRQRSGQGREAHGEAAFEREQAEVLRYREWAS